MQGPPFLIAVGEKCWEGGAEGGYSMAVKALACLVGLAC